MSTLHLPHFHAPRWFSIIGMDVGVIMLPIVILGSLFLIARALSGM
jgi:hypothetical protein